MPKIAELRLGFREIIFAPLQALRIGNIRLILFTGLMGYLATLVFSELSGFLLKEIENNLKIGGNLAVVLNWAVLTLGLIIALPLVLVGVATPVRVIWATGSFDLKNLARLTPGSLLVALRSCIRHLPQFGAAILPALVGVYLIFILEQRGPSQPIARVALLLSALLAILIALRQIVLLLLALMLAISGQVDMRMAYSVILRASGARLRNLVSLTACMISIALAYCLIIYFGMLPPAGLWIVYSAPIFIWYFLVCYTLLAIQIGFEQGSW